MSPMAYQDDWTKLYTTDSSPDYVMFENYRALLDFVDKKIPGTVITFR